MSEILPLEYLGSGEHAEIVELSGEPKWIGRLGELGLRAGSRFRVLQGGSPCLLQIAGSRLSLRGDEMTRILVRPVPSAD